MLPGRVPPCLIVDQGYNTNAIIEPFEQAGAEVVSASE